MCAGAGYIIIHDQTELSTGGKISNIKITTTENNKNTAALMEQLSFLPSTPQLI